MYNVPMGHNILYMKKEFIKFQISKSKMNELKGGVTQNCHCGGSTTVFQVKGTTYEDLERTAGRECGTAGWACTPVK